MLALEKLFRLEIEFHRRLRIAAAGTAEAGGLHTSYALQSGYELLLRAAGTVSASEIERLSTRLLMAGDSRDVLAARDSLARLVGLHARDA